MCVSCFGLAVSSLGLLAKWLAAKTPLMTSLPGEIIPQSPGGRDCLCGVIFLSLLCFSAALDNIAYISYSYGARIVAYFC